MGGYERGDHAETAKAGLASALPGEAAQVRADYRRVLEFDIRTVRETSDWALVDRAGRLDFRPLEDRAKAAAELGVQIIWTLFARPWPGDIHFLSSRFVDRFARYAGAAAARLAEWNPDIVPVYAPVNEISYQAWSLFEGGRVRRRDGSPAPAGEIKYQLARAALAACEAILAKVPHARLLHTDPLEHVVAPLARPELAPHAARRCEMQFEAWDLLAGRSPKDLGGQPRYLDVVGVNYYAENQWELESGKRLAWNIDDTRRLPLSSLLKTVHARYGRPIAIAETSHNGDRRGQWVREIAAEVRDAARIGIPIEGICLHPMIDQRDATNPSHWLRRGIWEVQPGPDGRSQRRLNTPYASALRAAQMVAGTNRAAAFPERDSTPAQ